MRPRDRILANLETTYREAYDKAKAENLTRRMEELDAAFQRDQLMLEILLDIRELLGQQQAAAASSSGALEKLQVLRNLTKPI
jgi:Spy/CpxP family protein refolding chaperone